MQNYLHSVSSQTRANWCARLLGLERILGLGRKIYILPNLDCLVWVWVVSWVLGEELHTKSQHSDKMSITHIFFFLKPRQNLDTSRFSECPGSGGSDIQSFQMWEDTPYSFYHILQQKIYHKSTGIWSNGKHRIKLCRSLKYIQYMITFPRGNSTWISVLF